MAQRIYYFTGQTVGGRDGKRRAACTLSIIEISYSGSDAVYIFDEPVIDIIPECVRVKQNDNGKAQLNVSRAKLLENFPTDIVFDRFFNSDPVFYAFILTEDGSGHVLSSGLIDMHELTYTENPFPVTLDCTIDGVASEVSSYGGSIEVDVLDFLTILKTIPMVDNKTIGNLSYTANPADSNYLVSNGTGFIDFLFNYLKVMPSAWQDYSSMLASSPVLSSIQRPLYVILQAFSAYINRASEIHSLFTPPSIDRDLAGFIGYGQLGVWVPALDMGGYLQTRFMDIVEMSVLPQNLIISELYGSGVSGIGDQQERDLSVQPTRGVKNKDKIWPDSDQEQKYSFYQYDNALDCLDAVASSLGFSVRSELVSGNGIYLRLIFERDMPVDGTVTFLRYQGVFGSRVKTGETRIIQADKTVFDGNNSFADGFDASDKDIKITWQEQSLASLDVAEIGGAGNGGDSNVEDDDYTRKRVYNDGLRGYSLAISIDDGQGKSIESLFSSLIKSREKVFRVSVGATPINKVGFEDVASGSNVIKSFRYWRNRMFYRRAISPLTYGVFATRFVARVTGKIESFYQYADALLFYYATILLRRKRKYIDGGSLLLDDDALRKVFNETYLIKTNHFRRDTVTRAYRMLEMTKDDIRAEYPMRLEEIDLEPLAEMDEDSPRIEFAGAVTENINVSLSDISWSGLDMSIDIKDDLLGNIILMKSFTVGPAEPKSEFAIAWTNIGAGGALSVWSTDRNFERSYVVQDHAIANTGSIGV